MEETKNDMIGGKKPSYEELEAKLFQVIEKYKELGAQLEQANLFNTYKRLDYLLKIIENSKVFPENFIDYCIKDMQDIMGYQTLTDQNK